MDKLKLAKLPEITRGRIDRHKVFSDFIELAAIRISNSVDPVHLEQRDARTKAINETYTDAEHTELYRYLDELMRRIKNNVRTGRIEDILVPLFEECGFSRAGQDQTPPDLARLTALIGLEKNQAYPKKGLLILTSALAAAVR